MTTNETKLPIFGGLLTAIGASVCCVGPFLLLSVGISGAWIGNLTLLEPYRPVFITIFVALFAWSGWLVHRPLSKCEPDSVCAIPRVRRLRQIMYWVTLLVSMILITSIYWIPLII